MASGFLRLGSRKILTAQKLSEVSGCIANYHNRALIGSREVVGFGYNGEYNYIDRTDVPMPAIRFKEESDEVKALRVKEKGDWKTLTIEEKKTLYRASFCQTFAEMEAPTGEWKQWIAAVLSSVAVAMWMMVFLKKFVLPPLPESFSAENKQKTLEFIIANRVDPIDGISSKWDYEKGQWKE